MIVLDTHVLVWWVNGSPTLPARVQREIRGTVGDGPLHASAISVFEIATAARRGRLALDVPVEQWLGDIAMLPDLQLYPVTSEIARIAGAFDDDAPRDPADRLIAATAVALGAKLVTADGKLRSFSQVRTLW